MKLPLTTRPHDHCGLMVGMATAVCCAHGPPNPKGLCTGNDTDSQSVSQSFNRWSHADAQSTLGGPAGKACIRGTVASAEQLDLYLISTWQQPLLRCDCSIADAGS